LAILASSGRANKIVGGGPHYSLTVERKARVRHMKPMQDGCTIQNCRDFALELFWLLLKSHESRRRRCITKSTVESEMANTAQVMKKNQPLQSASELTMSRAGVGE